jgi:hypothetical protein
MPLQGWRLLTSNGIHVGGPDIEANGLSLCALPHKLFDLGVAFIG